MTENDLIKLAGEHSILLFVSGTGAVSHKIKEYSPGKRKVEDRISHIAAFGKNPATNQWTVTESHFKTKGVKEKTFSEFLEQNEGVKYAIKYPHLNYYSMTVLAAVKTPYPVKDIWDLYKQGQLQKGFSFFQFTDSSKDHVGAHCAESICKCDYGVLEGKMKKRADEISPNEIFETLYLENVVRSV